MLTEKQQDRIKGVLFGGAVGDALGLGTEFMSKEEVRKNYPNGLRDYSEILQDAHRQRWKPGMWTDDTDQAICIINSILKNGNVSATGFAEELYKWFKGKPMGIGQTVLQVVRMPQYVLFPHKAAEIVWKLSQKRNASNGGIMRTSVLGAWEFWDAEKVAANTETICMVTHFDPRCVGSCVIITAIICNLIANEKELSETELVVIAKKYDERIIEYIEIAKAKNISELRLDEPDVIGYTLKTFSAALWVYFYCNSFEDGLLAVVNEGGDADTNAAVACSLLGAKFGFSAIPVKYIRGLLHFHELEKKADEFMKAIDSGFENARNQNLFYEIN